MQSLFVMNLMLAAAMVAQQAPAPAEKNTCPLHAEHMKTGKPDAEQRFEEMNTRGTVAMGFDQVKTTHHFRTLEDGGAIEVTVNDAKDAANLAAVRKHLQQLAKDFAQGNFKTPLATHGELPAGTKGMQAAKHKIRYRYEELPQGGRVRISTKDAAALAAVHEFLAYQVNVHRTGDKTANHSH